MSEIGNLGVQFILDDPGLVLDENEINAEDFNDFLYGDGTRTILLSDHTIQGDDTIVLHKDDWSRFYLSNENGQLFISDGEDASVKQNDTNIELITQLIDDENPLKTEEPEILYVTGDGLSLQDEDLSQYQMVNTFDAESGGVNLTFETQVLDLEEFMRQEGNPDFVEDLSQEDGYQYVVLKDGKLHFETCDLDFPYALDDLQDVTSNFVSNDDDDDPVLDVSDITGKNLVTGQTMTLHSYIEKLQKKKKNDGSTQTPSRRKYTKRKKNNKLNELLNKKLHLGNTVDGKKLIGKIIQVKPGGVEKKKKKKSEKTSQKNVAKSARDKVEDTADDPPVPDQFVIPKIVSKECFQYISRTLEGLMIMNSVKKKLEHKNIIVKIVESRWVQSTKDFCKTVYYTSGYMKEIDKDGALTWTWITDDTEAYFMEANDAPTESSRKKSSEITNITLMVTFRKNGKRVVRVALNQDGSFKCRICLKEFRTSLLLKVHLNKAHRSVMERNLEALYPAQNMQGSSEKVCDSTTKRGTQIDELKCHICSICFLTELDLNQHLSKHIKPYFCEACGKCFFDLGDLENHSKSHNSPAKNYECGTCHRAFTRHSNLLRHEEIHTSAGDNMFTCHMCGCSYHYMSSLTRHLVQNHIGYENETKEETDPLSKKD